MNTSTIFRTAFAALCLSGMSAQAEWRCDCTTIVDTCSATVTVEDAAVSIKSDHLQCSRVDYMIDGQPFVALVVEGRERQDWLSRTENPRVLMQSCQVCLDNAGGDSPPLNLAPAPRVERELTGDAESARDNEPARLLAVEPQYPSAARGTDGFVEVSFTVTALGLVENAIVTVAEPPAVFEQSALAAISRWRYNADESRGAVTLSHRFDFKAANAPAVRAATVHANAETAIDALIAHSASQTDGSGEEVAAAEVKPVVRNHCIREELSYDFGEMVDVSLMNTCNEPLMVYSCAEGVGRYQRRWVCQSGESAKSILVRPGDRLAGNVAMVDVPEGVRTFRYAEDFFVARPRNTAYWWLACGVEDTECRGSGRQWARSMDGKAASIDPQLWTQQNVARSY